MVTDLEHQPLDQIRSNGTRCASLDRGAVKVTHDEYQARAPVGVWPCGEGGRRMEEVMHALDYHWLVLTAHIEKPFHPQQVFTMLDR